ncbi:DUF2752 domain-containing protein [Trichothermofontia sp.]
MYPLWRLSSQTLSPGDRQQRWGALALMLAPLMGAPLYNQGLRLPGLVCPLRHWTGIPCPTCGLTRSLMAVVRGDWNQAITEHLFGPVLFIVLVLGVLQVALELTTGRHVKMFYHPLVRQLRRDRPYVLIALGCLLGYYTLRLGYWISTGELAQSIGQSPLGQMLGVSSP